MMRNPTDQKIDEMREATRAANETLSDLKRTLKEVKKVQAEVHKEIDTAFDDKVATVVADTLASYRVSIDEAIENATQAVFDRFDTIHKTLTGETRADKRAGRPSIPEMIESQWCAKHKCLKGDCWDRHS
jgi:predicted phage-related endonuclease